MQPGPDPAHAEQHDAEEPRLQEESGQHFIAHQRTEHGPGPVGEAPQLVPNW